MLQFGIPSLDFLLGVGPDVRRHFKKGQHPSWTAHCGICVDAGKTTSLSIVGPHGTGKSILALHLASRYFFQVGAGARVMYVSTDLKHSRALQVWHNFALNRPRQRRMVFASSPNQLDQAPEATPTGDEDEIALAWYGPAPAKSVRSGPQPIENYLLQPAPTREVAFLDLARFTAGDDWGFLNRVISVMAPASPNQPMCLLIVDAVEGFEWVSGSRDAFGETLSRRARISQILQLAADKCHLVLISEIQKEGEHGPEVFVTDAVVRLRNSRVRDYSRRTVEVEKVRGQSHIRGEHALTFRTGRGSNTGDQQNDDDPVVTTAGEYQAYGAVFPSVHSLSRELMEKPPARTEPTGWAGFGIPRLDELLGRGSVDVGRESVLQMGLPLGTVTALIGDPNTQKIKLGYCFLAEEFRGYFSAMAEGLRSTTDPDSIGKLWVRRSESDPVRRSESRPPEGSLFYVVLT